MDYSVGDLAQLSGVTVRTLHHYGQIGLLEPAGRTASGYRRYTQENLDRLRDILFYRELGFGLEAIGAILAEPGADTGAHLRRQHTLLRERIARLHEMVALLKKQMEAHTMGIQLTPQEKFEIFGPNYSDDYEAEAQDRWGDTAQWQQSQAVAAKLSKQDWVQVKADGDDLNRRMAQAMLSGAVPDSDTAMDLAQEHHGQIERFYTCSYAMHRGLGDMYLADPRFTRTYESVAPGLAQWLRDAIHANADRREQAPA